MWVHKLNSYWESELQPIGQELLVELSEIESLEQAELFNQKYDVFRAMPIHDVANGSVRANTSSYLTIGDFKGLQSLIKAAIGLRGIWTGEIPVDRSELSFEWGDLYGDCINELTVEVPISVKIPFTGMVYAYHIDKRLHGTPYSDCDYEALTIVNTAGSCDTVNPLATIPDLFPRGAIEVSCEDVGRYALTLHTPPANHDKSYSKPVQQIAGELLDMLCNINLNVVVALDNGILSYRATDGLSAVWMALCHKFAHTRIDTCRACNTPMVISGERGNKRQFCSEACRKWRSRNPDESIYFNCRGITPRMFS